MRSIQFDVTIESEKNTGLWTIPAEIYKGIMEESAPVANYTNFTAAAQDNPRRISRFRTFSPDCPKM